MSNTKKISYFNLESPFYIDLEDAELSVFIDTRTGSILFNEGIGQDRLNNAVISSEDRPSFSLKQSSRDEADYIVFITCKSFEYALGLTTDFAQARKWVERVNSFFTVKTSTDSETIPLNIGQYGSSEEPISNPSTNGKHHTIRLYEAMYILKPDLSEAEIDSTQNDIRDIIKECSGTISKDLVWGKRRLSYEINKFTEGIYVNLEFKAENGLPGAFNEYVKTHTNIIRHLVFRVPKAKLIQEKKDEDRLKKRTEKIEQDQIEYEHVQAEKAAAAESA